MRRIFLDTVGLIGLWDSSDQWHASANAAYDLLKRGPFIAVTSSLVLLECANAAARRPYRAQLIELRRDLLGEGLVIVPSEDQMEAAWSAYEHHASGTASVVDLISFQIMRQLEIAEAFTNDRHFKAVGFTTLF